MRGRGQTVRCCRRCNSIKDDRTLAEFKAQASVEEFFCEALLGVRMEFLDDFAEVEKAVLSSRRESRKPRQCRKRVLVQFKPTHALIRSTGPGEHLMHRQGPAREVSDWRRV